MLGTNLAFPHVDLVSLMWAYKSKRLFPVCTPALAVRVGTRFRIKIFISTRYGVLFQINRPECSMLRYGTTDGSGDHRPLMQMKGSCGG